jgi:hypothetical protein
MKNDESQKDILKELEKQHEEELRKCKEEGIACSYGICKDCSNMN